MTVSAGPGDAWTADFGASHGAWPDGFDILYGMNGNASVADADSDFTSAGSGSPPFVAGELEGRIWGGQWARSSSVDVQVMNGGTPVYSGNDIPTDENGGFNIEHEQIGSTFAPGMVITVSDANYTKVLTLADCTFDPLDAENDKATGTAPAGSSVDVEVWGAEGGANLTVTAGAGSGAWEADFSGVFDIVRGADGEARVWEDAAAGGDGDCMVVHPERVPWFYAGNRSGICGSDWAASATVDVALTDGGAPVKSWDDVPTDENGWFDVQEWTLEVTLEPDMLVEVTDGTWTKQLTIVPLTLDSVDFGTDVVTGTGPAGETVSVEVGDDSGGDSKEVTVQGDGSWSADFSPFNVTATMSGGVARYDVDGDATRDEWYPPSIQATYAAWDDYVSGDSFTPGSQVSVSLYQSAAPGAPLVFAGASTVDSGGSFQVSLESVDLQPGMKLLVIDPFSLRTKRLDVVDVWVDVLDPVSNTISGTAPAGSEVWIYANDESGGDIDGLTATANGSGLWSVDVSPGDLGWGSGAEVGVRDADGDDTRADGQARRIECDLAGDVISGTAFSRSANVAASVFAAPGSSIPLWSASVSVGADGRLSVPRSIHGLNLTGGMVVRIDDSLAGESGITKTLTLSPLTFDVFDVDTDMARGTGEPGAFIHVGAMVLDGGGEVGYPVPDALGNWSLDFAAAGWDVTLDMTAGASVLDDEFDATHAPFIPYVTALQSSTHPDPDLWYASGDPAFSWTPSPSTAGYSWVLDQASTTVPDETIDGTSTSQSFSGKEDGVWYFHVRAVGGPGTRDGGPVYGGTTSHLRVRIDGTAPTVSDNADAAWHASAATVTLSPSDSGCGVQKTQYRLQGAGSWSDAASHQFSVPAPADGSNDGAHVYEYRALDNANNASATGTCTVRIDTAAPAIASVSSSTHGLGSAWSTNNDPVFDWTAGASARARVAGSDIAGYSWTLDQTATSTPDEVVDGTGTRASFTDVADGVWYLHVRARDAAGNWGAAQHAEVRIDAGRPTPKAYAASVLRGRQVGIGYRLDDPVGGCSAGNVKIVIKNARGKVIKTKTVSNVPANVKKVWKFACRFPAGRYTIRITGSDIAGNTGTKAATAVLRVR
jgi:hypothetical protein